MILFYKIIIFWFSHLNIKNYINNIIMNIIIIKFFFYIYASYSFFISYEYSDTTRIIYI